jgi:hypothetical protein
LLRSRIEAQTAITTFNTPNIATNHIMMMKCIQEKELRGALLWVLFPLPIC